MASLIEEFIDVLNKENSEYEVLLEMSNRKTPIIVKGDVEALAKITDEEQVVVDRINQLEKKRIEVLDDIASVLNKDVRTLQVPELIRLLSKQTRECRMLQEVYDKLKVTLKEMVRVNDRNRDLIKLSLEMVEFDMNLLQAMKSGPETGDYNSRGGYNDAGIMGSMSNRFDAKQ